MVTVAIHYLSWQNTISMSTLYCMPTYLLSALLVYTVSAISLSTIDQIEHESFGVPNVLAMVTLCVCSIEKDVVMNNHTMDAVF